jgi:hypothetical protein
MMMSLTDLTEARQKLFGLVDAPLLGGTCVEIRIEETIEAGTVYALVCMPMTQEERRQADNGMEIETEVREYEFMFTDLCDLVSKVQKNNFEWSLNEEFESPVSKKVFDALSVREV